MDISLNLWGPRPLTDEEQQRLDWEWITSFDDPPFEPLDTPTTSELEALQDRPPTPRPWWIEFPSENAPPLDGKDLCSICMHINFTYLLCNEKKINEKQIDLGTLENILERRKQCSFCRLVVRSISIAYGHFAQDHVPPIIVEDMKVLCYLHNMAVHTEWPNVFELRLHISPSLGGLGQREPDVIIQSLEDSSAVWRGRLVGKGQFEIELASKWLHQCETQHDTVKPSGLAQSYWVKKRQKLPSSFRCIDVRRWCLAKPGQKCRYLALSYVWGQKKVFQCTRTNVSNLEKDHGLALVRDQLPRTITDAIQLTAAMGEQYLWVDSICIVQDDDKNKQEQLSAMDAIYCVAALTIVSTSGTEASSGLSGLSPGSRTSIQHVEAVQGLKLVNSLPKVQKGANHTVWNSRGWTYQERVLSQRLLFITSSQIIFKCPHSTAYEDKLSEGIETLNNPVLDKNRTWMDVDHDPDRIELRKKINFISYVNLVEDYTPRKLSFSADILNAFTGCMSELEFTFRGTFLYGLPDTELDSAILWQPHGMIRRRIDPKTNVPLFPSWSWAGWEGPVGYYSKNNARIASRVKWLDASSESHLFTTDDYRAPMENVDAEHWDIGINSTGVPYYFRAEEPDLWFLHPVAREQNRRPLSFLSKSTDLKFLTLVASFSVTGEHNSGQVFSGAPFCENNSHTACPLSILTPERLVAGTVQIPAPLVKNLKWGVYDFVLLSRTSVTRGKGFEGDDPYPPPASEDSLHIPPLAQSHSLERGLLHDFPFGFDHTVYDKTKSWCLYNVMMVEWNGEVASRIGLGIVHIDAFHQAQPKERKISLS